MRTYGLGLVLVFVGVVAFGCGGSVIARDKGDSTSGAGGATDHTASSSVVSSTSTVSDTVVGSSVYTVGVGGSTGDVWAVVGTAGYTVGTGGSTGDVWGVGGSTSDVQPAGPVGSVGAGGGTCTGETHETLTLALKIGDSPSSLGCSLNSVPPSNMDVDIQGAIVQTSPTAFAIYTCPPGTPCDQSSAVFSVDAPGLMLDIPKGTYVDVHIQQDLTNGCADMITIRNLPVWQGVTNPVSGGDTLWLEAADGTTSSIPGAPVTVGTTFECSLPTPSGSCVDAEYALVFSSADGTSIVSMGQSGFLPLSPGQLTVHNMRSFFACENGPGNWGYWMTSIFLL